MLNRPVLVALLAVALACAGDAAPEGNAADTTRAGRARAAAAVADAILARPQAADSILRAAGYTADEYGQLMYDIAADSVMSAEFTAARAR